MIPTGSQVPVLETVAPISLEARIRLRRRQQRLATAREWLVLMGVGLAAVVLIVFALAAFGAA